jgi:glycosyltransferase involved in cell wall biosynthesis
MKLRIYMIAYSQVDREMRDGGSRIFAETAKCGVARGHDIHVFTSEEGFESFRNYGLINLHYTVIRSSRYRRLGIYLLYVIRAVKLLLLMMKLIPKEANTVIYSSSDFWPDSIPAWILKMRFKNVKWIAGFYLFAPNPLSAESPYKGKRFIRGLLYYLSQLPVYYLVRRYADMVWVTSEPDRWKFVDSRLSPNKVIAVRGGVDVKTPALIPEPKEKKFDAVFIGRFHPQKGVLELIDIWKYVVQKKKDAQLAVIGVGGLEREVREKIRKYGLEDNITLFGFKDGIEKLKIFKDSKIVLHPAVYDSGGMAACEAMACGLPGVSFDLPALKTYYPKGMLKTPCYDKSVFAENVLKLLNDEKLYEKISKDALDLAKDWDWDNKSMELLAATKQLVEKKVRMR